MEHRTQDKTVIIIDGCLADAVTREIIPPYEPIVILRASNPSAISLINRWLRLCDLKDVERINQLAIDFLQFENLHRAEMKLNVDKR